MGVSVQWPGVRDVGMAAAMDKSVRLEDATLVDTDVVRNVLELVFRSESLKSPVQSLLPMTLLQEPLSLEFQEMVSSVRKEIEGQSGQ